ncbi:MAG: TlpA family protein disulfide reductase [Paracoccaceae bacterium]
MKTFALAAAAALYALFALSANQAPAADLSALLTGQMQKMVLTDPPRDLADAALLTLDDAPASLAAHRGKWVVLNFWATWCAPCRVEMPSLDRLQAARPGLVVLPVASGPNPVPGIARFWQEAGITGITSLRDPSRELSAAAGVLALPVTLILNPAGQEVARLIGHAEWDAPETLVLLDALMAPAPGG